MMKIIKQPNSDWSYKFTCSECDCELEAEADDLIITRYDGDPRELAYDAWSVNCPVCSHSIIIREDKIPKLVKIKVKQKASCGGICDR